MISSAVAVRSVVDRNLLFFRRDWALLVAGFLEPIFWLIAIDTGLSAFVADVDYDGQLVEYTAFVAPGLIAASALNAAAFDSTYNFYYKLAVQRIYDAMIATPLSIGNVVLGEVIWSVLRATLYSTAFLVLSVGFGLIESWWALLIVPASALIGFSISAVGIFSSTFVRSWNDFDYFGLAIQLLFIGSATFYPITVYPTWAQVLVNVTPLYHGVALCRALALGTPSLSDLFHLGVLLATTAFFAWWARQRLEAKLLH